MFLKQLARLISSLAYLLDHRCCNGESSNPHHFYCHDSCDLWSTGIFSAIITSMSYNNYVQGNNLYPKERVHVGWLDGYLHSFVSPLRPCQ